MESSTATDQTTIAQNLEESPAKPDEILNQLAPDTIPLDSLAPKPANKARAIRLLLAAKRRNVGRNRQLAVFLLASLGFEYDRNRDELLRAWHHCVVKDLDKECDEETAMALIGLYRQGHKELLHHILAGCRNSDGALSEELYPFYLEQIEVDTTGFVSALALFPPRDQRQICARAGEELCEESGGGPMAGTYPATMRKVLEILRKSDGITSARCSRAFKQGYREMAAAIQEEEKGPPSNQK